MLIQEMEAFGTHGTTVARAISINSTGFSLPNGDCPLKRGSGCYFWEDYSRSSGADFARDLARAWWDYKNKRGDYAQDSDIRLAIITAHIKCDDANFIDFLSPDVRGAFHAYYKTIHQILNDGPDSTEKIEQADIYGMFLDSLEDTAKRKFDAFRVSIPFSGNSAFKAAAKVRVFGDPIALVVKNVSCIKSLSTDPRV